MPRRVVDYAPIPNLILWNQISTIGAFMIGFSVLLFLVNVLVSHIRDVRVATDPWGGARHVEWKLWEEGRVVLGEGLITDSVKMLRAGRANRGLETARHSSYRVLI